MFLSITMHFFNIAQKLYFFFVEKLTLINNISIKIINTSLSVALLRLIALFCSKTINRLIKKNNHLLNVSFIVFFRGHLRSSQKLCIGLARVLVFYHEFILAIS